MSRSFANLHEGDGPLLLPNAWDVGSAIAFLADGFPAIGTTSLGVAAAAGLPDASRAIRDQTLALARQLSRLPAWVSVDVEDGFDDSPETVAAFVALLEVAGINLEDSSEGRLVAAGLHADKVVAVKERRPDLFLNARVDTFWLGDSATVDATVDRALRYLAAGADGIFVPGNLSEDQIAALTAAIPAPVNVLASPDHTLDRLGELGVRRVSTGSWPYRAALDAAANTARRLRDCLPVPAATPYATIQTRTTGAAVANRRTGP